MIQTNMISFTRHFILLVLLSLSLIITICDAICPYTPTHLNITNGLGAGLDLTIHCKSKDDDLGQHVRSPFWWRIYYWFLHQLLENHSVLLWHVMVKWIPLVWYLRCFQGSLLWRLQLDNTSNWAMRGLL
jgi:hypothetical protein